MLNHDVRQDYDKYTKSLLKVKWMNST